MNDFFDKVAILGVRVDEVYLDDLLEYIFETIRSGRKAVISNVNVHAINIAVETAWFREFINRSQVVFCDGFGVKWAARFLYGRELQRFTPPDWFDPLADGCARQSFSMFFLGTRQDVIERAAAVLTKKYPALNIVGVHHGFFEKNPASSGNQDVLDAINRVCPDILVVGFGMPMQEKWILDNWDQLQVQVAIPVGAFFDYLAGEVVRAPRWMTDHGLEWLGRLLIEPRRLWKRYVFGNLRFLGRILLQKLGLQSYDSL
jgi:N-acetylglucosaminyldiphosphoundecaprenol N-acetyl-beta-D-mannosaminyltransferase